MMRNDYRRALILLRSNAAGYSGHVRLERRTLMGSMYFMVQTPETAGKLQAALVGQGRDGCYACPLGELKRDSRGQAVLGYSFDPRNVCSRELEQYQLIVVVHVGGDACDIVLSGNVAGHAEINWEQVRTAVCGLYAEDAKSDPADLVQQSLSFPEPEQTGDQQPQEAEISVEAEPAQTSDSAGSAAPAEDTEAPPAQKAGDYLGIDLSLPWPEEVEALRMLFMHQPAMEKAPDDEFIYVKAPLPAASGYSHCAAGIRIENGIPAAVRYALPAAYASQPPAGLECAVWTGDNNAGWWVSEIAID